MKRTTQWFASHSGARSRGRKQPAELNIQLVRRELLPVRQGKPNTALSFAVALLQLMLIVMGVAGAVVSGLSMTVEPWLLYGGLTVLCVAFTVFFYDNWLTGARLFGALAMVLLTAVAVLFLQSSLLSGLFQLGRAVLERMNSAYQGDYMLPAVTEVPADVSIFLLIIFVPLTAYLGAFSVRSPDPLLVGLLMFPLLALLGLAGAEPSAFSLCSMLLGALSLLAYARVGDRRGLWGKKDSSQWKENWLRRQKISAVTALTACVVSGALMLPSLTVLAPSLAQPLAQTAPFAAEAEGWFAQLLMSVFSNSPGQASSPVAVFGGGVTDGALNDEVGYLVDGLEELRLRCTVKPQETLYLRGFIGGSYEQNRWQALDDAAFDAAASNWETEGNAETYLYNLPFLRMLYEQRQAGVNSTMAELTVERINASGSYTYTPYGAYLNDYYEINGDGAVAGQDVQDDVFSFYFRADQLQTLEEEFFLQNESALDRLERSYAAFAVEHYSQIPAGFEELQAQCDAAQLSDSGVQEIIAYVQEFLNQNYKYSLSPASAPEGEDTVRYFLYESKTGYSIHFASAATIMFRMLGLPARYVVGYAASESLFTAESGGVYQAVLQSDNAHAWVEIYISGTGWLPVETTPGVLGLVQDMEYYGEPLTPETTVPTETETQTQETTQPQITQEPAGDFPVGTVVVVLITVSAVMGAMLWLRRRIRDFGLDWRKTAAQRVRAIFAAYYRRLLWAGMPAEVESTSPEFSRWVLKIDPALGEKDLRRIMELVLESCFGRRPVCEKDVRWMRWIYRDAILRIRKLPKQKHNEVKNRS